MKTLLAFSVASLVALSLGGCQPMPVYSSGVVTYSSTPAPVVYYTHDYYYYGPDYYPPVIVRYYHGHYWHRWHHWHHYCYQGWC